MLEVELKSVVDDVALRRKVIEDAGAVLVFAGKLEDRRYDTRDHALTQRDQVLRMRVYRDAHGSRAQIDWKGPTSRTDGYKQREELEARVADGNAMVLILEKLGYIVTIEIDREIAQYEFQGAMVRFEHYPRMDDLVEVEGTPTEIERAIAALGMPRAGFTTDRLPDFALRYKARTGVPAALSHLVLAGDVAYDETNA